ncbi:MAG TPA: fumarate hydratase [Clostridiaceae bacterium]|nr:fumarate hydratase [Clostridiaceae bacterium]
MTLTTPLQESDIANLKVGDMITISGKIYCGRDAVLPKVQEAIAEGTLADLGIELEGAVIFHTAVSTAGVGPTSSNKFEIESSIHPLSVAGVRLHLGKGALSQETIKHLGDDNAVYAVIPPVTALLGDRTISKRLVSFPELGMEALYELEIEEYPAVIAAANGKSIYD